MKHTPAPWKVHNNRTVFHNETRIATTHKDPDPVFTCGIARSEAEANARLIAAAPELLTALEILTGALSRGADTVATQQATKQARAAIEKAKG